jgi:hypothetical protein
VIVKYQWTKIAGPANYTIEKPNYPVTNLTNLQLGSYTFQLAVTDQFGVVRTDAVNVNVTSALPVTLNYLKGDLAGKFNNLTWATSHETNLDHFEILRSTDGVVFNTIGRLPAGRNTYTFTDDKAPAGTSYYRLKNVDKDGAFRYSDIIVITNNGPVLALSKYPNPVLDVLNVVVQGEVYGKIEISIINPEGRLVNKQTVNKQGLSWKGTVNTAHLQKGVYTIQVLQPGKMKEVSSFVKE